MKYNIGQIIASKEDVEMEKGFLGDKVIIPKGNKIIIGADSLSHHIRNGFIQSLSEDSTVEGFSTKGIAEWLYIYLRNHFPIDEMLEDYDETPETLKESIADALEEIGFYDNTGNRS